MDAPAPAPDSEVRPTLSLWTVYMQPRDFPDHFVARRWETSGVGARPTDEVLIHVELEGVREQLRRRDLTPIPRMAGDDPVILETWL